MSPPTGQVGRYKDYVSGKTYDYTYDGIGRLIRTNVSDGSRIRANYNTMDQLSDIHYQFADNGRRDVYYSYSEKDDQPLTINFGSNSAYEVYNSYDDLRRLTKKTMGILGDGVSNVTVEYDYLDWSSDANRTTGTIRSIAYSHGYEDGDLWLYDRYYTYDEAGNILTESVRNADGTRGDLKEKYTYDLSGQLTRHDSAKLNKSFTFEYDDAGNLTKKCVYAYTTGTLGTATDTYTYSYIAGTWSDRLSKITVNNNEEKPVTYDNMGNMTTFDGAVFSWQGRQLSSYSKDGTTTTYKYNADGIRTSKTVGSTKTEYFLNGNQVIAQKTGDSVLWFIYDSQGTRVAVISGNYVLYYMYNLQGDVIGLVNGDSRKVVATYKYDAWGNCTVTNAPGWTIGTRNPFRYRGYYYDSESGLYYLNSRYYDPELGRFISPDALVSTGQGFTGFNMYAYCGNNPVVYSDANGNRYIASTAVSNESDYDRFISCDFQKTVTLIKKDVFIDLTGRINSFAAENAEIMEKYADSHNPIDTLWYFKNSVTDGGPLDIKLQDEWAFEAGKTYIYNGSVLRYDDPGNIIYGYVGAAIYPRFILCAGAGWNQFTKYRFGFGDIFSWFDDPRDNYMIKYGYMIYRGVH